MCAVVIAAVTLFTGLAQPADAIVVPAAVTGCSLLTPCGPPVVSAPEVMLTGPQSATITATINPENAATEYVIADTASGEDVGQPVVTGSTSGSLPASDRTQTVSWDATGLTPGTSYAVGITASNGYLPGGAQGGGGVGGGPTAFTTPLMPATPYRLTISPAAVVSPGEPGTDGNDWRGDLKFAVRTPAGQNVTTGILLQAAYPPSHVYETIAGGNALSSGTISWQATEIRMVGYPGLTPAYGPDEYDFGRNVLLRIESLGQDTYPAIPPLPFGVGYETRATAFSAPVELEVYPKTGLDLVFAVKPQSSQQIGQTPVKTGWIGAWFTVYSAPNETVANAGGPKVGRRAAPVYLYHEAAGSDSYRRIATLKSIPGEGDNANFSARIYSPSLKPTGRFLVCTRTPFSPYLGLAFAFDHCGSQTIAISGPRGSEFVFPTAGRRPTNLGLFLGGQVPGVAGG